MDLRVPERQTRLSARCALESRSLDALVVTNRVAGQAVISAECEEKSYEAPLYN
jgi:hypothetical protein